VHGHADRLDGTYAVAVDKTLTLRREELSGTTGGLTEPVRIAIAHNKGGVSKTTSTYVLGRHLSRDLRVELVDLDQTRYLTEAVAELSPRGAWLL